MRCSYKPQSNSLGSILYCLLTVLMTSYLLYLGIRRYFSTGEHDSPQGSQDNVYSIISVALHGFAMVMIPFFIATCCFKVGNLASDGERLGDRTQKVVDVLVGTPVCRKLKSAWQHGPPVAQTIHLSVAFALLMARTLMETQFFKHHYGSSILQTEEIWSTDLEFLYNSQDDKLTQLLRSEAKDRRVDEQDVTHRHQHQHYPRSYQLPEYDSDRTFNGDPLNEASDQVVASAHVSPKLLPFLTNFRLYGISLLFFNYAIALFIYASAYPSVYWRASKAFSLVFCCHLLLHAIASVFAFIGFVILYRFQVSGASPSPFILNEYLLVAVYIASCVILFFASSVVYGYGYNKFCLRLLLTAGNGRSRLARFRGTKTHPVCCEGYCPHIAAILMLILMVAAKAPVLYDQMILYQKNLKSITMVCIVVDVVYLFAWILLWLGLTLKREWAFNVRYTNSEIGALLGLQTEAARPVTDSTLMVVCGEDYFATDDESKRAAILQLAEKCGLGQHDDEVYWLKPSHGSSGNGEGKQSNASPEMNNLLSGSTATGSGRPSYQPQPQPQQHYHQHQIPHSKAATIGVSGGNYYKKYGGVGGNGSSMGYSKVSFSDGEPDATPYLQKRPQEQRFGPTRASGSYVRFNDDQSAAGFNYDDHATQDIVSTFGTLPRQDYQRRRMFDNGTDLFSPTAKAQAQTLASVGALKRTPSPMRPPPVPDPRTQTDVDHPTSGFVTYAAVHKRSGSPNQRAADYGRIIHPQPQHAVAPAAATDALPDSENISRVSSYANIPNSSKPNWDAVSLSRMDPARPPTGRTVVPPPANGHQQPQQYHNHQHHYSNAGSTDSSPSFYSTLPQHPPVTIGNTHAATNQPRRQVHYKPTNGSDTVTVQPRASPKNSPNLELDAYHGVINGQGRKLTSFSNSSSASGGAVGGESSDTTPTQQTFGMLSASSTGPPGAMAASASGSSREMTPLSNGCGSLNRPIGGVKPGPVPPQQPMPANWRLNSIYGPATTAAGQGSRAQTPQGGNYGPVAASPVGLANANYANQHQPQHIATGNMGIAYYDSGYHGGAAGRPAGGLVASTASGANGRTLLGLESHDRNDSANFSLTSSNESDNNQFVTSIV